MFVNSNALNKHLATTVGSAELVSRGQWFESLLGLVKRDCLLDATTMGDAMVGSWGDLADVRPRSKTACGRH